MKNLSLEDEIRRCKKRLGEQLKSVQMDEAFLKDEKACKEMPAVAAAVRERLKRTRANYMRSSQMADELEKAAGKLL